jgi:predicted nucleic acid-binding protein
VTRSRAVFDASVVVRATLDAAPHAKEWLDGLVAGRVAAVVPELLYAEVANAFVLPLKKERLRLDDAIDVLEAVSRLPFDVRTNRSLFGIACGLAVESGVSAYDAHYLALAEAEDAVLVTADRTLAAASSRSVLLE